MSALTSKAALKSASTKFCVLCRPTPKLSKVCPGQLRPGWPSAVLHGRRASTSEPRGLAPAPVRTSRTLRIHHSTVRCITHAHLRACRCELASWLVVRCRVTVYGHRMHRCPPSNCSACLLGPVHSPHALLVHSCSAVTCSRAQLQSECLNSMEKLAMSVKVQEQSMAC